MNIARIFTSAFLLMALFTPATFAAAHRGGEVGNGGDVRRYYGEAMLAQAIQTLSSLRDANCGSLPALAPEILVRVPALISELQHAAVQWTHDDSGTCLSFSKSNGSLQIQYSYLKCDWVLMGTETNRNLDLGSMKSFYQEFLAYALSDLSPEVVDHFALQTNSRSARCYRADLPETSGSLHPGNASSFPADLETARMLAIQAVFVADPLLMSDENVKHWFVQNRSRLIQDLTETGYVSVRSNPYSVCANTEASLQSPIQFGSSDCQLLREWGGAVWLILHETAHHLGILDEAQADALANAIVIQASDGLKPGASF